MINTIQTTFCWKEANNSRILNTASRIKARNHILIQSRQRKEHLNQIWETWFKEPSSNTEKFIVRNRILTESKLKEAQKHWSDQNQKRYSWIQQGLLLTLTKSLLQICKTGTACKQTWETKLDIELLYFVVICSKL